LTPKEVRTVSNLYTNNTPILNFGLNREGEKKAELENNPGGEIVDHERPARTQLQRERGKPVCQQNCSKEDGGVSVREFI